MSHVGQNDVTTYLGVPAGYPTSEARAINNAGQVVALANPNSSGFGHPFLWQNGVWTDLGPYYAKSVNINNNGQILIPSADTGHSYLLTPSPLIVSGFPSPTTAGASGTFTVTATDGNGNTLTGYTGTIHFTSSDPQASLPADYAFTAADAGVHTFSATLKTAGTQWIMVSDTANAALV